MKHPVISPIIAEIARHFGLEGVRAKWDDGRVFVYQNGKWREE